MLLVCRIPTPHTKTESPVALKLLLHQLSVRGGAQHDESSVHEGPCPARMLPNWNSFAAKPPLLREQLEQAVGPQQRPAQCSRRTSTRDAHRFARRAQRQADGHPQGGPSAVAGAARRGRPARAAAQWLRRAAVGTHEDDTVDVFTSGRKMRLTCSPNIEVKELKQGQTVRLNEALTVVEAGAFEAVGEISTLREILADGHRALVVGHADEERIVWLAEPLVAAEYLPGGGLPRATTTTTGSRASCGRATRCWSTPRPGTRSSASPRPRSRIWCSKRCPTSATTTSAA